MSPSRAAPAALDQAGSPRSAWYERVAELVAALLPLSVAIARAASGPQWRSDVVLVRDQALAAIAPGGGVSTPLTQLLSLFPLGNHEFRAAAVAALGLALACFAIVRIARRMLAATAISPPLSCLLATVAAATAGLSPTWQAEATVGGGATVAAALALVALEGLMDLAHERAASLTPEATRRWLVTAALCGAACAENLPCGGALVAAVAAAVITAGKRPALRLLPWLALVFLAVLALLGAPLVLRPLAPGSLQDLARALSSSRVEALHVAATQKTALLAWSHELGIVSLALAGVGLATSLFRHELRAWTAALVALALVDLVYPLAATSQLVADPLAALRLLALAAFAVAAALGIAEAVATILRLRVPMGRAAAALIVVFHVTVVAVASEEASFSSDRSGHHAAEAWTDRALGALPPRSAVLVHSSELAWRLWAAQTLDAERPDVVVIPAALIARGIVPANLVLGENAAAQVLRDLALTGQAGEFGLSLLADARPLHVELDPRWDKRLVKHLSVEGAWLRYAPQLLGRSDRKPPERHPLAGDGRLVERMRAGIAPDPSSFAVLTRTVKEHAAALALIGMGEASRPWLEGLDELAPGDPFVTSARLRLAHAARMHKSNHCIDLRDLLRF